MASVRFCLIFTLLVLALSAWATSAVSPVTSASKICFADLDGDGLLDLAHCDDLINRIYLNVGTASAPAFNTSSWEFTDTVYNIRPAPAFCDIDLDGDMDYFYGLSTGCIGFQRNTGTASSPAWTKVNAGRPGDTFGGIDDYDPINTLYFVDFDGDGDQDITFNVVNGEMRYYKNKDVETDGWLDGQGVTWQSITYNTPFYSAGGDGGKHHWTDEDGDGDFDAILGYAEYGLSIRRNYGGPTTYNNFAWEALSYHDAATGNYHSPFLEDFDGDGFHDLYYTSSLGYLNFLTAVNRGAGATDGAAPVVATDAISIEGAQMNQVTVKWPVVVDSGSSTYRSGVECYELHRDTSSAEFTPSEDTLLWKHFQQRHEPDYMPEKASGDKFKISGGYYYYKDTTLAGGYTYYYKLVVRDYAGNAVTTDAAAQELAPPYFNSVVASLTPTESSNQFTLTVSAFDQYGVPFIVEAPPDRAPNLSFTVLEDGQASGENLYDLGAAPPPPPLIDDTIDGVTYKNWTVTYRTDQSCIDFTVHVSLSHYIDETNTVVKTTTTANVLIDRGLPTAPTNVRAPEAEITLSTIVVRWNASTDADNCTSVANYKLYGKKTSDPSFALLASPTGTSYSHTGLLTGTSYSYYVVAVDRVCNLSAIYSTLTATTLTDTTPPSIPTNLSAVYQSNNTEILLEWNVSTDTQTGVKHYEIQRKLGPSGFFETVFTQTHPLNSWMNSLAYPGYIVYYRIRAVDNSNNVSEWSNTAEADIQHDTTPPSVPTGLAGTAQSSSSIRLTWNASTDNDVGVRGYRVYRNNSSTHLVEVTTTSHTDTGLTANTLYSYKVSAVDKAGNESSKSSSISVRTMMPGTKPNPPQNLAVDSRTPYSLVLEWDAPVDNGATIVNYRVYRHASASSDLTDGIIEGNPTARTFTINDLEPSTTYYFTVTAWSSTLESDHSNRLTATTQTAVPTTPENLRATQVAGSFVDLAWNASTAPLGSAIDHYNVYFARWNPFGGYTMTLIGSTIGTTYHVTGLTPFTSYKFAVRAYDTAGRYSGYTDPLSVLTVEDDTTPPPVPTGLQGSAIDFYTLYISWNAVTDTGSGTAGYELYRNDQYLAYTALTGYTDQGLDDGVTYNYKVRAVDHAGNKSELSAAVPVTTPVNDQTPPGAPTLTGQAQGAHESLLNWNAVADTGGSGVAGYEIYRDGALLVSTTAITYVDGGLTAHTAYAYKVRAFDGAGNRSAFSNTVTVTTNYDDSEPPPVPTNLSGTPFDSYSITVSWDAVVDGGSGLAGYELYRDGSFVAFTPLTTHLDTGLDDGVTYSYTVLARDEAGNKSAQSDPVEVTTPWDDQTPPGVPVLTAEVQGPFSVNLSWTEVTEAAKSESGLAGYELFRDGALLAATKSLLYADTNLTAHTTYTYTVRSYDNAGNRSPQSIPVQATTEYDDQVAPPIPSGLVGQALDATSVKLDWNAVVDEGGSGLAGYDIFRDGVMVGQAVANTYVDNGLTPFTAYQYTVRAVDNAGNASGQTSPPVPVTTPRESLYLYATHVASTDYWMSGLALINVGDHDSPVTFTAINAQGLLVEEVELASLPPLSCYQADFDAIFSPPTFQQDIWVRIAGTSLLRGVQTFGTRDLESQVTVPIFSQGATDLVFPYVVATDIYYTGLTLVNTGKATATPRLVAYDEVGDFLDDAEITIPSQGKYVRLVEQVFSPEVERSLIRFVMLESETPLVGFELFGSFLFKGLAGLPPFSATVDLFKADTLGGGALPAEKGVSSKPATPSGFQGVALSDSEIYLTWNPNSEPDLSHYAVYSNDSITPNLIGTTSETVYSVTGRQPLTNYRFSVKAVNAGGEQSAATAPLLVTTLAAGEEDYPYRVYYSEIPDPSFYDTGITFSNLGNHDTNAHLYLYDADGNELATADVPVSVREQRTSFLEDFFTEGIPAGAAYLKVGAAERLMGFELFLTADWVNDPFQLDGVVGVSSGATTLHFPLVRSNEDWQSWLKLVNLASIDNLVRVQAYGFAGESMGQYLVWVPSLGAIDKSVSEMFPDSYAGVAWVSVQADAQLLGDLFYLSADLNRLSAYMGLKGGN